jgi:polar amino acid transport system substrate-binding protein
MRPTPRSYLPLAAGLAFALLLAACGRKDEAPASAAPTSASTSTVASAPTRTYLVGTDAAYAPFESQNPKGEIVGFDVDVVGAAAKAAGLTVKFVNTPWEGIFNALAQGDRDLVASAVTITDERRQTMDFSDPYFDAQQLIAVPVASPVKSFADLRTLKIGVQTGTTGDEAVSKLLGKTNPNIRRFESTPLALQELQDGGVDAVVADNGVVIHYVVNNPGGKFRTVADDSFVHERYGIAVKKGNTELLAKLNQGLAAIRADGEYARLYARYFGATPAAPAPAASH